MAIAGQLPNKPPQGDRILPVSKNPQTIDPIIENAPIAVSRPDRNALVDSNYAPAQNLVSHIEGAPWTCNYYRQVLGKDNTPKPLQPGVSAVHQQYDVYRDYILRVNSAITSNQDSDTKEFTAVGEASMFYGLVPNVGDMFIADAGGGEVGLFTLTEVERMGYMKQACYRVNFQLVCVGDDPRFEIIDSRINRQFVFDVELLELMDNPFLSLEDHLKFEGLAEQYERISKYFKAKFWSAQVNTLKVPEQDELVYDGFHSEFCRYIGLENPLETIRVHQLGGLPYDGVITLWNAFKELSSHNLMLAHREFNLILTNSFVNYPVLRGIYYTQFRKVVYPSGDFGNDDPGIHREVGEVMTRKSVPEPAIFATTFKPITADNAYVLSQPFYDENTVLMCDFERRLYDMLEQKAVAVESVADIAAKFFKLPLLEQYYYGPLILVLINYCKRNPQWI